MGQLQSVVQEVLAGGEDGSSPRPNDGDEETQTGTGEAFTGFEEGLDRTDILVETGLTVEAYIRRGLDAYGGRLRQQAICTYTGWSEATVSRTLSEMEEAGLVTRIRLGREYVVCLPDAVPAQRSLADD